MTKTCSKCERSLPLDQFSRQRNGRRSCCKDCQRTYRAAYYQLNAEQAKADRHEQYWANLDTERVKSRAQMKEYQARMRGRSAEEAATAMSAEQRCSRCREVKPREAFALNRTVRAGIQSTCKECYRDGRYGLEPGEYNRRLDEQGGGCAICGKLNPHHAELSVDHDHNCCPGHKSCGKCTRGLLCQNCNAALGMFGDDPEMLSRAIAYLKGVVHHRI